MKKIKMGMIGGGIGAFIGDAHRRASRICNDFELVGGVFDSDYEKSRNLQPMKVLTSAAVMKALSTYQGRTYNCLPVSEWRLFPL